MPLFVAFLLAKKQEGLIYASISVLAIVAMVIVGFFGPETSHRKITVNVQKMSSFYIENLYNIIHTENITIIYTYAKKSS